MLAESEPEFGQIRSNLSIEPRLWQYVYSSLLAGLHFWLLAIGLAATIVSLQIPLIALALERPSKIVDLFSYWIPVSRIGGYICAASTLVFVANMVLSLLRKRPAH